MAKVTTIEAARSLAATTDAAAAPGFDAFTSAVDDQPDTSRNIVYPTDLADAVDDHDDATPKCSQSTDNDDVSPFASGERRAACGSRSSSSTSDGLCEEDDDDDDDDDDVWPDADAVAALLHPFSQTFNSHRGRIARGPSEMPSARNPRALRTAGGLRTAACSGGQLPASPTLLPSYDATTSVGSPIGCADRSTASPVTDGSNAPPRRDGGSHTASRALSRQALAMMTASSPPGPRDPSAASGSRRRFSHITFARRSEVRVPEACEESSTGRAASSSRGGAAVTADRSNTTTMSQFRQPWTAVSASPPAAMVSQEAEGLLKPASLNDASLRAGMMIRFRIAPPGGGEAGGGGGWNESAMVDTPRTNTSNVTSRYRELALHDTAPASFRYRAERPPFSTVEGYMLLHASARSQRCRPVPQAPLWGDGRTDVIGDPPPSSAQVLPASGTASAMGGDIPTAQSTAATPSPSPRRTVPPRAQRYSRQAPSTLSPCDTAKRQASVEAAVTLHRVSDASWQHRSADLRRLGLAKQYCCRRDAANAVAEEVKCTFRPVLSSYPTSQPARRTTTNTKR